MDGGSFGLYDLGPTGLSHISCGHRDRGFGAGSGLRSKKL